MDAPSPKYIAYDQRGREGVGARERQASQQERAPEGQQTAKLEAMIAKLEARVAVLEKGNNLTGGEGITVNGNVISLNKQWRIIGKHTCDDDGQSIFDFTIT